MGPQRTGTPSHEVIPMGAIQSTLTREGCNMALTAKQQQFVAEYLIDLNATQAAIRAGYSAKTAEQQAYQQLQKTSVQDAIAVAMKARSDRTAVTADRVLAEFAKLAFLDPRRFYDANGGLIPVPLLPADVAAALSSMEVIVERSQGEDGPTFADVKKIKFADKKGALDSCARHLGMFTDKLEHSGGVTLSIADQIRQAHESR